MSNMQIEMDEMTDFEIRQRYGSLISQAAAAFSVDPSYTADIVKKAKLIEARRAKRKS